MKNFEELKSETIITVQSDKSAEFSVMSKEDFKAEILMGFYDDVEELKVTVAEMDVQEFSFSSTISYYEDEMYEDWGADVINDMKNSLPDFKNIEKKINDIFGLHPSFYEGEEVLLNNMI
jgi:hypothetical protein